jgi:hypothetical protein
MASPNLFSKQHYCGICQTKPDQISHHKAHLKTQKHLYKKKCFEQCAKMTIMHFHTETDKTSLVKLFESETGIAFDENRDKFGSWRFNHFDKLQKLFQEEYPHAIVPCLHLCFEDNYIETYLQKIVEANETITVKPNKNEITEYLNSDEYLLFKNGIQNKSLNELLFNAVSTRSSFDMAAIFFKIYSGQYSCKDLSLNKWVNKADANISCKDVLIDLRRQLTATLEKELKKYKEIQKDDDIEAKEACEQLILDIKTTAFKDKVLVEAKELFFNN